MSLLLESTIKMSLVLLAALTVTSCLRERSAAVRHWVLAVALICAGAVPVLGPFVPSWHVRLSTPPSPVQSPREQLIFGTSLTEDGSRPVGREPSRGVRLAYTARRLVAPIWIAGVAVSMFVLLVGVGRLAWLASRTRHVRAGRSSELAKTIASEYGLRRSVRLLQSSHPTLLVTWGFRRPSVLLPRASGRDDARVGIVRKCA